MDVKEYLKTKEKKADFVESYVKELQGFQKKKNYKKLTAKSVELGLILLNAVPELFEDANDYHHSAQELVEGNKRFVKINEIVDMQTIGKDFQDLWTYFLGEEISLYMQNAFDLIPTLAYQRGWSRRSFTAPQRKSLFFVNQINFAIHLINYLRYNLTIQEFILYSNEISLHIVNLEYLFVSASKSNQDIYNLLLDITYNRHETAKVSRQIIKAMLLCDKKEAWEAVEKLLLAAQRQEGLRQTILECLDETNLDAVKHLIKVILDEKLTRFSSVVRALDVWAGLGWEAQKESTIVRFMKFAHLFLTKPESIEKAIESKDNAEVYMALWAQGMLDVDGCVPLLDKLLKIDHTEKNLLALYFVEQIGLQDLSYKYGVATLDHFDLAVFSQALNLFNYVAEIKSKEERLVFFDKIEKRLQEVPVKGKLFEGKVFSWLNFAISRNNVYQAMINLIDFSNENEWDRILTHVDQMDGSLKGIIANNILPEYYHNKGNGKALTQKQRDFALKVVKDRNDYVRIIAMNALEYAQIEAHEAQIFLDLLSRKSAEVRKSVIGILLKLSPDILQTSIEKLLKSAVEQRLAGLDLITQCKSLKLLDLNWLQNTVQVFGEYPKITEQEKIIVNKLLNTEVDVLAFDASNGYGLYDPNHKTPYQKPVLPTQTEYLEATKENTYGLSQSPEAINKALVALEKLILKHKNFEYQYENWNKSVTTDLLGNGFNRIKRNTIDWTNEQHYNNYPLPEVWEKWVIDSKLTPRDLMLINLCAQLNHQENDLLESAKAEEEEYAQENENKKLEITYEMWANNLYKAIGKWIYTPKIPNKLAQYHWHNPVVNVLNILPYKFPYLESKAFLEGLVQNICYHIPAEEVGFMLAFKTRWNTQQKTWRNHPAVQTIYNVYAVNQTGMTDDYFTKYWHLQKWKYETLPKEFIDKDAYLPTIYEYARAFDLGYITKDEMMGRIMKPDAISELTQEKVKETVYDVKKNFPFLAEMIEICKNRILEIELKRGDSSTAVTSLASSILKIEGVHNFTQILLALGKDTLHRGYIYSYGNSGYNKKQILSILLKRCLPLNSSQAEFDNAIKTFKITEKRLTEAVTYSPQWIKYAETYLGWKNMQSAIWWLHAHTNGYHSAETETEIAHYSKIEITEFKDGAVDTLWFKEIYKSLGKEKWQMLYDSAKYISDGNGHTRAKLYADVILGNLSLAEIAKRVKDKRNQDYLRVYGLVALNKKNPDKDTLERYQFLQKFKKESKQFGAQKQASEALAVKISMDNLARNAGYPDPMRLTWAMETEEAIDIINRAKSVKYDEVSISLTIDEDGKSEIECKKGDKILKSIPDSLKKDASVIELKEFDKTLKDQYKRTRKSLEEAMINGDAFAVSEIQTLMRHPVVSPILQKLVLKSDHKLGFWQDGKLISAKNEANLPNESVQIAHCTDLFASKEWSLYQKHCFEKNIKQPFKQIFRELYVPTEDELKERSISRRYAGHQVQPKKTLALLKTQGWTVDYDEGLQKVFHKEGFIAKIYAMADWFSPSDVESPTLETIEFIDRKTWKSIPFEEMSARIFSEVMRDVDLVVSVAHVGEVDPEASQSSIELRTAIVNETLRLFKIDNVELKGQHALIKGTKGDYSVHLGSAIAHKVASSTLFILPVHSQHRGRMFLPFLDEDPRTAEIVSKIILLAKDHEIQDPTILRQL